MAYDSFVLPETSAMKNRMPAKKAKKPALGHNKKPTRTEAVVKRGRAFYLGATRPREIVLSHGKGSKLWDIEGNDYIDLGSGIAVNAFGHQNAALYKALTTQAKKLWHVSNYYFTEPSVALAENLVKASGFGKRVFFCNSGAEANEGMIKIVRKYAADKGRPPEKREIITFYGSFHGRTLATVTATAQPKYQEGFEPLPGGFVYCNFNDEAAIRKLVSDKTCAIVLEPIQGEGGVTPAKPGYLKLLRELCDKVGALLVFDEIQCGMGRTGKLFAFEHEKVKPDIVTLAKALGGGFPIGAILVGDKAAETMQFGSHGSTFGGNPLATAVAGEALRQLQSKALMKNVADRAKEVKTALTAMNKKLKLFKEVRGLGLMIGAELTEPYAGKAGDMVEVGRKYGVLFLQAGPNVLRILPPLTISKSELAQGLKRMEKALVAFIR